MIPLNLRFIDGHTFTFDINPILYADIILFLDQCQRSKFLTSCWCIRSRRFLTDLCALPVAQ